MERSLRSFGFNELPLVRECDFESLDPYLPRPLRGCVWTRTGRRGRVGVGGRVGLKRSWLCVLNVVVGLSTGTEGG